MRGCQIRALLVGKGAPATEEAVSRSDLVDIAEVGSGALPEPYLITGELPVPGSSPVRVIVSSPTSSRVVKSV